MLKHSNSSGTVERRRWPTSSIVVAGVAMFIALSGTSAIAAKGLIRAGDIATGAVATKEIKNGQVMPNDLNASTMELLGGDPGDPGEAGATGPTGAAGANGVNGTNGPNGANGANGPNGANGVDGTDGTNGTNGTNGTDGTDGIDGIDGTVAPLFATSGVTALPTGPGSTTVVNLAVPAGKYVVLAKSQLSHTGAGDSVDCQLKAGGATIDQVAMKTLPALAAIPMSLQAVTTVASPSQLTVDCHVLTANGSANFSSLIAIPTA
jgi:hypothetical protein